MQGVHRHVHRHGVCIDVHTGVHIEVHLGMGIEVHIEVSILVCTKLYKGVHIN